MLSIQAVLAAGFLFLSGGLFFLFSFLLNADKILIAGLGLMLIGILPLRATLGYEFDQRFPQQHPESDKEDEL